MQNPFAAKKTVATVLSGFQKVLDDLSAVRDASLFEVDRQAAVIDEAIAAKKAAEAEAAQALAVSQKIGQLIGGF